MLDQRGFAHAGLAENEHVTAPVVRQNAEEPAVFAEIRPAKNGNVFVHSGYRERQGRFTLPVIDRVHPRRLSRRKGRMPERRNFLTRHDECRLLRFLLPRRMRPIRNVARPCIPELSEGSGHFMQFLFRRFVHPR